MTFKGAFMKRGDKVRIQTSNGIEAATIIKEDESGHHISYDVKTESGKVIHACFSSDFIQ